MSENELDVVAAEAARFLLGREEVGRFVIILADRGETPNTSLISNLDEEQFCDALRQVADGVESRKPTYKLLDFRTHKEEENGTE